VNKRAWLDGAEIVDSWRVVPRLIVCVYLGLLIWVTVYFSINYFAVPAVQRTVELTAFTSVVMTAAFGALPFIVKIYMDGGRAWGAPVPDVTP
jgi:glucose dehydrogenase